MPREVRNQLTHRQVQTIKKPGRYADGNGLYLNVSDHGGRWWIWRGTVQGKRRELGMGSAFLIPLVDARATASDWRVIARSGGDPARARDVARGRAATFEDAARRVWQDQVEGHVRSAKHAKQWISTLEAYAFPIIGHRPIGAVSQADVLAVLRPIWTDKSETALRLKQRMKTVFDWARVAGYCEGVNPVEGVEKALPRQTSEVRHMPAVPYEQAPEVYAQIVEAEGMGALALRFAILTAARSGEVRKARWDQIDFEARVWTMPVEVTKTRREHRVPLSDAAIKIIKGLPQLEGLIFFSTRPGKPLSDMTLGAVHKRLKIDGVPHGWRSTFRDWAEETTDTPHSVSESALAHKIKNRVEAAYRRGDLFDKRRNLMDHWAKYLTKA